MSNYQAIYTEMPKYQIYYLDYMDIITLHLFGNCFFSQFVVRTKIIIDIAKLNVYIYPDFLLKLH